MAVGKQHEQTKKRKTGLAYYRWVVESNTETGKLGMHVIFIDDIVSSPGNCVEPRQAGRKAFDLF